MGEAASLQHMTPADYLAWEREQPGKHEYHHGEVFAMAGGSPRHNALSGTMIVQLGVALSGKGCRLFTSDQRMAADDGNRYVYPDVTVVCGRFESRQGTSDVLLNPHVVVEVLSRSTERFDRGEKWEAYQRLPSLTDYVLVSQASTRIEHYQREADGSWRYRVLGAGDTLSLSNGAAVSVDAVYEGAFELDGD